MNETIKQFNYPESLIKEFNSWVVLLRPQQITLGSLVLACKGEYSSLAEVPAETYAELTEVIGQLEQTLKNLFKFDKINYLLLMMRDKYVHFHVIPRYAGPRKVFDMELTDMTWPMPPDITKPLAISSEDISRLTTLLRDNWATSAK